MSDVLSEFQTLIDRATAAKQAEVDRVKAALRVFLDEVERLAVAVRRAVEGIDLPSTPPPAVAVAPVAVQSPVKQRDEDADGISGEGGAMLADLSSDKRSQQIAREYLEGVGAGRARLVERMREMGMDREAELASSPRMTEDPNEMVVYNSLRMLANLNVARKGERAQAAGILESLFGLKV